MTGDCVLTALVTAQNTVGVSVVTNFHQYKKFNVRSILDPPVKGGEKDASKKETDKATSGDKADGADEKEDEE